MPRRRRKRQKRILHVLTQELAPIQNDPTQELAGGCSSAGCCGCDARTERRAGAGARPSRPARGRPTSPFCTSARHTPARRGRRRMEHRRLARCCASARVRMVRDDMCLAGGPFQRAASKMRRMGWPSCGCGEASWPPLTVFTRAPFVARSSPMSAVLSPEVKWPTARPRNNPKNKGHAKNCDQTVKNKSRRFLSPGATSDLAPSSPGTTPMDKQVHDFRVGVLFAMTGRSGGD